MSQAFIPRLFSLEELEKELKKKSYVTATRIVKGIRGEDVYEEHYKQLEVTVKIGPEAISVFTIESAFGHLSVTAVGIDILCDTLKDLGLVSVSHP